MPGSLCTVCGAVLQDGACPNGHPQRAATSRRRHRQQRRKWPTVLLVILVVLGAGAYVGLVWYPERAAADLMRPSSAEFAEGLESYGATVSALPPGATDPSVLFDQANAVLEGAGATREDLSSGSASLEARAPIDLPVVSSRPPLEQAIDLRERMGLFYTGALEVLADLESIAGYLTEMAIVVPQLADLEEALGGRQREIGAAVQAAIPIADQLIADLEALVPPDELGSLHSSLLAIARRMRQDLDEITRAGQASTSPVVAALLDDVLGDVETFRQTIGTAPDLARQGGLGSRLRGLNAQSERIIAELKSLRDDGVSGLTIPE